MPLESDTCARPTKHTDMSVHPVHMYLFTQKLAENRVCAERPSGKIPAIGDKPQGKQQKIVLLVERIVAYLKAIYFFVFTQETGAFFKIKLVFIPGGIAPCWFCLFLLSSSPKDVLVCSAEISRWPKTISSVSYGVYSGKPALKISFSTDLDTGVHVYPCTEVVLCACYNAKLFPF